MTPDDRKRFAEIIGAAAILYAEPELSRQRMDLYFSSLMSFDIAEVLLAMHRHFELSKFFPKPAELAGLIRAEQPQAPYHELVDPRRLQLPPKDEVLEELPDGLGVRIERWAKQRCDELKETQGNAAANAWIKQQQRKVAAGELLVVELEDAAR